jgi:hypothetical protein
MTCRHGPNDITCSSHPDYYDYSVRTAPAQTDPVTPDKKLFKIINITPISATWDTSGLIILEVRYPNCSSCSFEGTKILLVSAKLSHIHTWTEIDPHFSDKVRGATCCPSPIARFPANKKELAIAVAKSILNDFKGLK